MAIYLHSIIQLLLYHLRPAEPMDPQPKPPKQNEDDIQSIGDLSLSFEEEEFNRLYTNELKKKHGNEKQQNEGNDEGSEGRSRSRSREKKNSSKWFAYELCDDLDIDSGRINKVIRGLPIFKKKAEIIEHITQSQVVLITGETGCGKSTQVPRLIYEYLRKSESGGKIICVQPRRLAVKNLYKILSEQIPEKNIVGYQIAMQTQMTESTKILFMTNGIFLQRLVHGTQFLDEYPFIVLDEVHERDIDTDFILLAVKRIVRQYPKVRIILMSATIDNQLFRYYFADDEIDGFMERENHYKKYLRMMEGRNRERREREEENGYRTERVGEDDELIKKLEMEYLSAKYPCPTVCVTEKVKYRKDYFYLDNLGKFVNRNFNLRWGSVCFSHKYPSLHRQLFQGAFVIIEQILQSSPPDRSNQALLIFLPGLAEIQNFASQLNLFFGTKRSQNFDIIKCHSSILNDEVTRKLHHLNRNKFKIIVATNIAESSITVMGVKYVIDFCLSKEVNFDQKSRMENLELVWASKASCAQRAGRTGRVCDGLVFRMVEKSFYDKFLEYSTPEIQRSSLDKLILRIKLIHENESSQIFSDPGEVLGTAIQPPNLKNIDEAIKSLIICGGLRNQEDDFSLTKLGRIYVDIPLDIIYSKMLIFSMLMGTYDDILILVCILSQNKNAFRKHSIEKFPLEYFEKISNAERCDFLSLIKAYKEREKGQNKSRIELDTYYEARQLKQDVGRRIQKLKLLDRITYEEIRDIDEYYERFKITISFGFLNHLIRVYEMSHEVKQDKRMAMMRKKNIRTNNTVVLLNSDIIKKTMENNEEAEYRLKKTWVENISQNLRIQPEKISITLGYGISFLHFEDETELNKLLFLKFMEKKRSMTEDSRPNSKSLTLTQMLPHLGDIDYMDQGSTFQYFKEQKIVIDNFSSNRIIAFHGQSNTDKDDDESLKYRLVLTNSIIQQSSRLSCRYTSLLPDIPNLDVILYLIFYPFIIPEPDRNFTKYDSISLKRKSKLKIEYELDNEQIQEANDIRKILKSFLELELLISEGTSFEELEASCNRMEEVGMENIVVDPRLGEANAQRRMEELEIKRESEREEKEKEKEVSLSKIRKMKELWPKIRGFIKRERKKVVGEQKWQEIYYQDRKIKTDQVPVKNVREDERQFMNEIKQLNLRFSFFSTGDAHQKINKKKDFEEWKLEKIRQVKKMEQKVLDHDPYIVCSYCQTKIAKLNKLGPLTHQYYRELFQHIKDNVIEVPFNEIGEYFCSMLMTTNTEKQYTLYACKNGHYLAIKFKGEERLKLLTFSEISIIYTDGMKDELPEFESLDYKNWRLRFEKSRSEKMKRVEKNQCFVCNQKFQYMKELEEHVKNQYHESNVRELIYTLPKEKRKQFLNNQTDLHDGY